MIRDEEKFVDELETPANVTEEIQENSNSDNDTFNVGDVVRAKATKIQPYGVFCKVSKGFDGLVHISRITHKYVKNVGDYFQENDEFPARVINVDRENKKLSLCTKEFQDQEDLKKLKLKDSDKLEL